MQNIANNAGVALRVPETLHGEGMEVILLVLGRAGQMTDTLNQTDTRFTEARRLLHPLRALPIA
jgi:hypothetical protein